MKRKLIVTSGLFTALLLVGCDEETHSIEWYKQHDTERQAMYDKCVKETTPRGTENCRNAIDAVVHGGNIITSKPKSW